MNSGKFLKRKLSWQCTLVFAMGIFALTACISDTFADNIKIGIVNSEKILRESAPAIAAQERLEKEFLPRDKRIKAMAEQAKALQDRLDMQNSKLDESTQHDLERDLANISRDYQRAQRQMREDLNLRQNEEYSIILEQTNQAIKKIAETERYDLILQLQDAVYRSERIDITEQVIKALEADQPTIKTKE